ncbi:MAG: CCA tRNA nucleotidyltransferase [Candidatus Eisenbacteria bacterium]|nr:CCA tRNA nucleotidyltransferase [Candidatus Eisenbacteria bacterium]
MALVIPGSAEHARREAERVLQAHPWPAELRALLVRLQSHGARAHLVGGPVRDVLLGRAGDPRWDIATSLTPEQVRATVVRVEPIGERHGTLLVIEHELLAEVTTFRREGAYSDARHPDEVWWTDDPIADLARRDLTINALAFDPVSGTLLDPFEGARDLQRKRLRAVGDPHDRLHEDALRALRVARFAAVLEMTPDESTREAMASVIERARTLAVERVRDELCKLMSAREPSRGWELLRGSGLLEVWLPEVAACHAVPQNRFHAYDVYFHLLHSCDAATPDKPVVRWAALLHDIGKPLTRGTRSDGDSSFHGHEKVGADLAHALLTRLRFPNDERDQIVHLVREHMFDFRAEWSDAAVRRFVRRVGVEHIADLFDLRMADAIGNGLKQPDVTRLAALSERVDRLLEAPHALGLGDLAVGGADVMEVAGLPPGPGVGALLERLLDEVLEDPARNTRERLRARIAEWSERPGRP